MPIYRVRQGNTFGRTDRPEAQTHAGQTVELSEYAAEPLLGTVLEGPVEEGQELDFDYGSATVSGVLSAVKSGVLSAEQALGLERDGDERVTLIRELEAMVGGQD